MIVTVLRSGGHYAADYVERIQQGLAAHSPDERMVCLSDCPVPCERIPLKWDWSGWWAKFEIFAHDYGEPVIYVDLDTLIIGDVTDLYRERFTMIPDLYRPQYSQSGVMAWTGDMRPLYRRFRNDAPRLMQRYRGDGECIREIADHDRFEGDMIQSAKIARDRSNARLICFHGQPRPRDVNWTPPK